MKQNEYYTLFSKAKGEIVNLSFELFQIIATEKSDKEKIEAFQFICENFVEGASDESVEIAEHYTREELQELRSTVGIFVDSVLGFVSLKAYRNHFTPTDFYELLWNMVFLDKSLSGEKENGFALYWILIDRFIPYVLLENKIDICVKKVNDFIGEKGNPLLVHRIRYIANIPLGKRTQRAALIVQELEALNSIEDKAILLTYALSEIDQIHKPKTKN